MASTISVDKIKSTAGGAVTFTLPTADGSAGHLLKTNGSAVLSFTADTDTGILNVVEDTTPQLGGFLDPNDNYIGMQKGGDIASASPTVIDTDGDYFICTGTTGFSAFTVAADRHFFLEFSGALIMTHGAGTLDLPGGANITTAASDVGEFVSTAADTVTCVNYTKATGKPVITDFANADINASAGIAVTKVAAMPYDIGFTAGFDADMVKEDVAVATYGEMVMARACTITGEVAYVDTAPTGATLIMDIMKNGTTIYASTKPLIAISANTHTVGVATTTALASGDRVTFKITQIGSSEPGEGVRFTLKCKTNTNE
jgi:hypothetical protein